MARLSSINYTAQNFPYATEPNDQFLKEDVQALALALETHDHGTGKGLKVAGSGITAPLDLPGAFRATGSSPLFTVGAGLEVYYEAASAGRGVLQAYDRSASVYKDLIVTASNITLAPAGTPRLTIQADGMVRLGTGSQLIFGTGAAVYGYGPDGVGTQLIGMGGLTVTPGMTYLAGLQVNGSATVSTNLTVNGGLAVAGTQTINQSLSVGLDLTVARNVGVGGQLAAGSLASSGYVTAAGDITTSGSVGAYGGNVFFESSRQVMIRWQPALTRLEMPYGNGLWASHLVADGGVTGLGGVVGGFLQCLGANGQFKVRPGRAEVTCFFSPTIAVALSINDMDHHEKNLWVNGGAGGTTAWQQVSARRYKANLVALAPAEATALVANPSLGAYRYTNSLAADQPDVGLLADEWAAVLPEVVQRNAAGEVESMSYTSLTPILLVALRALLGRVEALEAKEAA